ncbi:MAG TPA: S26 family signal peptidase, partial [Phycisphaerae bacterium]|nr:S26 family signal peptidase [Phycisphaerae bacterium]
LQNDTGYNQEPFPLPDYEHKYVGDLSLHAVVNFLGSTQSAIAVTLGQPANCYQVRLNHNGTMGLYKLNMDKQSYELVPIDEIALNKTIQPLDSSQTLGVTMSNIDHEVRFWVNDNLVLDYQIPWTVDAAKSYVQDIEANPSLQVPLIYLDVTGDCTLRHLILMRDIYYTQTPLPATGTMDNPITLHAGEYFMLGDNTNDSEDSRLWNQVEPVLQSDLQLRQGVVPQRYMIGRAFMVYWPAGFRPAPGINWPIVPNVGRMRLVR